MKVLLLIDNLNSGGAQRQIVNLAIGLKKLKSDVTVMTYNRGEHFQEDLIKHGVRIKPLLFSSNVKTFYGVIRAIGKEKPDVLCAYLFVPSLMALVSKLLFRNMKCFVSERFIEHLITDQVKPLCRALYPVATGIVANSKSQTGILQKKYPAIKNKIHYIGNCVDTEAFRPTDIEKASGILKMIGVGRLVDYKNVKVFIEAVSILYHEYKIPLLATWVGREYEERGVENKYYNECIDIINSKGLSNVWIWAGKQKNVGELFNANDVLVHPSYGEGFPNVVCEALASGTPVIASNVIDHPFIIEEGFNGFLFDPLDVDALVQKILVFSQLPPGLRAEMKVNCRKVAEEKFSPQIMISKYFNLFSESIKPN